MTAGVGASLNRWPAVGLAVGVVRNAGLEFFYGHGVADIASNTPVTEDTVFRVGSLTKTFTAIAVMQLYEQGRIDLDAPASEYLRACKLRGDPAVPTGPFGLQVAALRPLAGHRIA